MTENIFRDQEEIRLDLEIDQKLNHLTGKEFFKGGFDRITPLFKPFSKLFKEKGFKVVIVGGTNGKGGTVHLMEQMFMATDMAVASFTSPHILSVSERIKFMGHPIDRANFLKILESIENEISRYDLSYFETIFLVFLNYVKQLNVEVKVVLLEVGLGGRLDATNQIDGDIAILTSISRDHTEILGKDLKAILKEKIEISRPNKMLITSIEQAFLRDIVRTWCRQREINWYDLFEEGELQDNSSFEVRNNLLANHVFRAIMRRNPPASSTFSPSKGRGELMTLGSLSFMFIGAHNVDGFRKMAQGAIGAQKRFDLICLSFSKRDHRDIEQCLEILAQSPCLSPEVWIVPFEHAKAIQQNELEQIVINFVKKNESYKKRFKFIDDYKKYFTNFSHYQKSLITGSNYFIGDFQQFMEQSGQRILSV